MKSRSTCPPPHPRLDNHLFQHHSLTSSLLTNLLCIVCFDAWACSWILYSVPLITIYSGTNNSYSLTVALHTVSMGGRYIEILAFRCSFASHASFDPHCSRWGDGVLLILLYREVICLARHREPKITQGPKQKGVGAALPAACVSGGKVSRVTCLCRAFKHHGHCGNRREPLSAGSGRYRRAYVLL